MLYDHRDDRAELVRLVVQRSPLFREVVELEKTTLSLRSKRLFTLSALYTATAALLIHTDIAEPEARAERALEYWSVVAEQFSEWEMVRQNELSAGEIRQDFIHSHGVVLHALGRVGNALFDARINRWQSRLKHLRDIDWRRANEDLWEGRAMVGGRVSKSQQHVTLTTNAVKAALDLPLGEDEQAIEDQFMGAGNVIAAE